VRGTWTVSEHQTNDLSGLKLTKFLLLKVLYRESAKATPAVEFWHLLRDCYRTGVSLRHHVTSFCTLQISLTMSKASGLGQVVAVYPIYVSLKGVHVRTGQTRRITSLAYDDQGGRQ
jgi:hypothetical protein